MQDRSSSGWPGASDHGPTAEQRNGPESSQSSRSSHRWILGKYLPCGSTNYLIIIFFPQHNTFFIFSIIYIQYFYIHVMFFIYIHNPNVCIPVEVCSGSANPVSVLPRRCTQVVRTLMFTFGFKNWGSQWLPPRLYERATSGLHQPQFASHFKKLVRDLVFLELLRDTRPRKNFLYKLKKITSVRIGETRASRSLFQKPKEMSQERLRDSCTSNSSDRGFEPW